MKPIYEKYHNALKNTKISASVDSLVSLFDSLDKCHTTLGININSEHWVELGKGEIADNLLPIMIKNTNALKENIVNSLKKACTMIQEELVNLLNNLENKEREINSLDEEERNRRVGEITSIENSIDAKIKEINSIEVKDFEKVDISSVNVSSMLQSIYQKSTTTGENPTDFSDLPGDIAAKRKKFLGDVNNPSEYTLDPNYLKMRKHLRLFNNATGEEIFPGDTIKLKPGEKLVITVKLPTNTGMIGQIQRTTADGDQNARSGRVVSTVSNVSDDPNNRAHVNYKTGHYPPGVDLHKNYYNWEIAGKGPGASTVSQTVEYTAHNNFMAKAMASLRVVVEG